MKRHITYGLLAAIAALAVACGAGETGKGGGGDGGTTSSTTTASGTGGEGPSAEQACSDFASARCARLAACSNGRQVTVFFGDLATCEGRTKLGCLASLDAPGTGRTPESTEACVAALPSESCADFFDNAPVMACQPEHGSLANGAGCGFSAQCESAFCNVAKGAICGVCAAPPAAGAPCTQDNDCQDGQVCPKSGICTTPSALGAPCGKDMPCAAGLSCLGASAMAAGSCVTAATSVGAACDPKKASAPGCERRFGLFCDPSTMACASITYAPDGGACGVVAGAEVDCAGGGLCVIPAGEVAGVCHAPAPDGAPCDADIGPPCLLPSRCVPSSAGSTAGTCAAPTGAACP